MTIIERAVSWARQIALDNSHGYSQADRWGPDYDCSSFVISAYEQAGLQLRRMGASYTGNMRTAFLACGFQDVTAQANLVSGSGLQAGDVLLNYSSHTCLYAGGGQVANARSDDGHPEGGDQTGTEIRLQSYWNYPWNCVLRYQGAEPVENGTDTNVSATPTETTTTVRSLRKGMTGDDVKRLQELLITAGYSVGAAGADGDFGRNTWLAVIAFQEDHGLSVDGIAGAETMATLDRAKRAAENPWVPAAELKSEPQPELEPEQTGNSLGATEYWPPRGAKETDDTPMKQGDVGRDVMLLQIVMSCRGYHCTPDGIFGRGTEKQVRALQTDTGWLPVTGTVDRKTWETLLAF